MLVVIIFVDSPVRDFFSIFFFLLSFQLFFVFITRYYEYYFVILI